MKRFQESPLLDPKNRINDFLKGNNLLRYAQSMKRLQESPLLDPKDRINDFLTGNNLFDPLDPINEIQIAISKKESYKIARVKDIV